MPNGIVAGQAWESEVDPPLDLYHQSKTGALFVAATMAGALASGSDPYPWRALGERLGLAYQAADDLLDALATPQEAGKPTGQDSAHLRPSLVAQLGLRGACERLESLVGECMDAIPPCEGSRELKELVALQATRLTPKGLARSAA